MDTKPLAPTGEYDTPTARILLVDERLIFCEGLRKLLEGEPGFTVVGNASDPDDALQGVEEHNPDIVIVSLAGRSLGRLLQTLQGRRAEDHRVRTIVLMTASSEATSSWRLCPRRVGGPPRRQPSRVPRRDHFEGATRTSAAPTCS